jgi:hypothetical protein
VLNQSVLLYELASGSLLLLGVLHNGIEWFQSRQATPAELQEAEKAMKAARVKAPGREVALYDFMKGFSYMMGYLFMAYGGFNLALASQAAPSAAAMVVNVLLCLIGLAVSLRYFFIVPTAVVALSGCGYFAAWFVALS